MVDMWPASHLKLEKIMPNKATAKLNTEQLNVALEDYIRERKAKQQAAKEQGKLFQNYYSVFGFLAEHSADDKVTAAEKVIKGTVEITYNDYCQLTDGKLGNIMKQAETLPKNFIKAQENAENMATNAYHYGYGAGIGMVR